VARTNKPNHRVPPLQRRDARERRECREGDAHEEGEAPELCGGISERERNDFGEGVATPKTNAPDSPPD
jgi:hypothetical protein